MFFYSWPLWEKMTFVSDAPEQVIHLRTVTDDHQVLGLAILGVFAVGYLKLLWMNRLVKRQELVDEEKRMRIQELRNSGQIVESRKSHDIPFGVRAIQSGITVDGIWISQSNSPIPSELKLEHLRNGSADLIAPYDPSNGAEVTEELTSQVVRPSSRQGRQQTLNNDGEPLMEPVTGIQEAPVSERPDSSGKRLSYKPRRASHLRFGSHGQYDATTLDQLEGKSLSPKKKVYAHRPRGSGKNELEVDSASAADNERSSGTSDDSDATLSHHPNSRSRQSLLAQQAQSGESSTRISPLASSKPVRASLPPQGSKAEYFSIPIHSPSSETSNPFATPLESPSETPKFNIAQNSPAVSGSNRLGESQAQPSQQSLFVPGELHVNKTIRKVNSGFEVLPAGTFGIPAEFKGGEISQDEDSGERRQSKLQKKPRTSMTGQRQSTTAEHP
jgi:hypothetical protein